MYYEKFDELCKLNGIRPGKVSKDTGISTATLTSWKQGKYTPKQDKLQIIADYFGITLEDLMDKKTNMKLNLNKNAIMNLESKSVPGKIFDNPNNMKDRIKETINNTIDSMDISSYYFDDDVRELAQFLHDAPEYKVLFDASRRVKKEDIEFVVKMLDRIGGE